MNSYLSINSNSHFAVVAPPSHVFSAVVGMARCAVPARVVAGGTNIRATLPLEGVAPLHAARTSQRDVPTMLNTCQPSRLRVRMVSRRSKRHRAGTPRELAGGTPAI